MLVNTVRLMLEEPLDYQLHPQPILSGSGLDRRLKIFHSHLFVILQRGASVDPCPNHAPIFLSPEGALVAKPGPNPYRIVPGIDFESTCHLCR